MTIGHDAPRRRAMWMAALLLAGTLATGVLVGVVLGQTWLAPAWPGVPPLAGRRGAGMLKGHGAMPDPREIHAEISRRLGKDLELTADQQAALDRVMSEQAEMLSAIQADVQPRMQAFLDSTRSRVDSLLTPAQRERFRRLEPGRR